MRSALVALALVLLASPGLAQEEPGIDVIEVSGPLDAGVLDFMADSIDRAAQAGQVLAVLQVDSPAVLDAEALDRLLAKVKEPPLPLAVWVGPAPARAYGGVALIATTAEHAAIAPGSEIGLISPVVAGTDVEPGQVPFPAWLDEAVPAEESGLPLEAAIRQYLQELNGVTFATAAGPVTVETVRPYRDGVTLKTVTLREPGLGLRLFRLAATPEAAYFFLVAGLTIAAFEFYAIGPGVAAAVSALSLLLAGWGAVNLPVRPWALAMAVAGWGLLTAAYQRGGAALLTVAGAGSLQVAGMFYVEGSGQIDPRWYLILPSVLAVLFFYLLAMPTVQRARFSTRTMGREGLVGETGTAMTRFDPDGVVEVRGARWRASAHREAGIEAGAPVVVVGVDGLYLEVEPVPGEREN